LDVYLFGVLFNGLIRQNTNNGSNVLKRSRAHSSNVKATQTRCKKEITLKARGQAITTAVDVAEITRNRFIKDLKVSKIAIGTVEMPPREGENKSRMVSTMEITLTKK
jgi:DNA-binding protein